MHRQCAPSGSTPSEADAVCNRGRTLLYEGDIGAAIECFERAIALEPRNTWYHWCLVDSRLGAVDAAHFAQLEKLADEIDTLSPARQIDLHFALAGVYERAERYDDAFRHLKSGNALKRGMIAYDEPATMNFFASLERLFTGSTFAALRACGNPSARPVFVFGMPRSGTTLIEQILAGHPAISAAGELHVLEAAVNDELMSPGMTLASLPGRMRALGDRYVAATDVYADTALRVTDKLPPNFRYAPLIHLALPNARMIHVRRDPRDTCFSCFASIFTGTAHPYTYDLGELGRYYSAYERLMATWRALLPPDRFLEVDYERVVADLETEARRLIAFCELEWNAGMLAFDRFRRTVRTGSAAQVRQPLYDRAVGRSGPFAMHLEPLERAFMTGQESSAALSAKACDAWRM